MTAYPIGRLKIGQRAWDGLVEIAKHHGFWSERCDKEDFELYLQEQANERRLIPPLNSLETAEIATQYFTNKRRA